MQRNMDGTKNRRIRLGKHAEEYGWYKWLNGLSSCIEVREVQFLYIHLGIF